MRENFIAELHDIGKLVNKDNLKEYKDEVSGHTFEEFNFERTGIKRPSSPSWWGQYHHKDNITTLDINTWNEINENYRVDLFLLILADHLASAVSRATADLTRKNAHQNEVVKLWDRDYKSKKRGITWSVFNSDEDLKKLFDEIENCPDGITFLSKYKEHLLLTPEDKMIPRNITTLYIHLELVGKIYRLLKKHIHIEKKDDDSISITYANKKVTTIKEAEGGKRTTGNQDIDKGKWQARFVKAWIKFPHSFVRLQDINLLKKREELLNCLKEEYSDEILFATSDFVALFLPLNQELRPIFRNFLKWGFYIDVTETVADLGILSSSLGSKMLKARQHNDVNRLTVLNNRNTKVYKKIIQPEYPAEIKPPICDICQRKPAIEQVYENIKEWLCDKCFSIREMGEPFSEYGNEWAKEGIKVCWFKFKLDQQKLLDWLIKAFGRYINENFSNIDEQKKNMLKEEFRPLALQVDFNNDYKEMLYSFWKEIESNESLRSDFRKPILDYNELGVFKFTAENVKLIIDLYNTLYEKYFPDCTTERDSPINLSLSIANIKYPIRDHWKYFEKGQKSFLNICYHRVFDWDFTKTEACKIQEIYDEIPKSYLHHLIEIERKLNSEVFVNVEIFNDRKRYPALYQAISEGIKISKLFSFYKLMED